MSSCYCGATDCERCYPWRPFQPPAEYLLTDNAGLRFMVVYDDCAEVSVHPNGRTHTIDRQTAADCLRWVRRVGTVERIG